MLKTRGKLTCTLKPDDHPLKAKSQLARNHVAFPAIERGIGRMEWGGNSLTVANILAK
jgi:hypothetical protein